MKFLKRFLSVLQSFIVSVWQYLYKYRKIVLVWIAIALFAVIGIAAGWDKKAIAFLVIIFGLISQAFVGIIGIISLVPIVGP
ncbi:MAG: hypothetical protein ACE5GL_00585 [Calditrichia bacterium]